MPRIALLALLVLTLAATAFAAPRKPVVSGRALVYASTQSFSFGGNTSSQRGFSASYYASNKAPAGASGSVDIPQGLGLGPNLPLIIQNPEAVGGAGASEVWQYWGCSATVPKGQPFVFKGAATATGGKVAVGSSGYADPMKLSGITASSSAVGAYTMHVSYLGDMSLSLGAAQEFLDPIAFTTPTDGAAVDTTKAIALAWNALPRAQGYSLMASGRNAAGKTVTWSSTRNWTGWTELGVGKAVKKGVLLPPDHLKCTIPAGIFTGSVSVTLTAYSADVVGKGILPVQGWAQSMTSLQLGQ